MEDNLNLDKHRPVWTRGLTATELDRRQELARCQNQGQEILLQSRLGHLKIKERRSVKRIERTTGEMLDILQNIKSVTPRLSPSDGYRGSQTIGNGVANKPDRNTLLADGEENVFEGENKHSASIEETSESSTDADFSSTSSHGRHDHLPRCQLQPTTPKWALRRRYSANDTLAFSLARFNTYKANASSRFPSTEAIDEGHDSDFSDGSRDKDSIVRRSRSNSISKFVSNSFPKKDDRKSFGPNCKLSESLPIRTSEKNSLALPKIVLNRGRATHYECNIGDESETDDDDDDGEGEKILTALDPLAYDMEKPLRLARRQSMSLKPATFRSLMNSRRNSSPEVLMTSTLSLAQRGFMVTGQTPSPRNASSKTKCRISDSPDLSSKIKDFLGRTENFIQLLNNNDQPQEHLPKVE